MNNAWSDLSKLVQNQPITVERVRIQPTQVAIEGNFELPPLARLSYEDQVFVAAFVKNHGSIKDMEHLFGVSYPTIKNRLNSISDRLGFLDVEIPIHKTKDQTPSTSSDRIAILERLDRGEISPKEAMELLKK